MVDRTRDSYRDDDSMPMPMLKLHERAPGKLPPQPEDRHQPVLQGILLGDAESPCRCRPVPNCVVTLHDHAGDGDQVVVSSQVQLVLDKSQRWRHEVEPLRLTPEKVGDVEEIQPVIPGNYNASPQKVNRSGTFISDPLNAIQIFQESGTSRREK